MSAQDPRTRKWYFSVDKCLPFGVSISCAHFQRVSNAIKHITQYQTGSPLTNYLDDFLFYALSKMYCNYLLREFLRICGEIGFPIAEDKTEWASEVMIFLGILLDVKNYVLSIPLEKRQKAIQLFTEFRGKNKAKVYQLQQLCGYLNFLCKAIHPGRVFTRRMYAKFSKVLHLDPVNAADTREMTSKTQYKFKQHYHVCLDAEFKKDCEIWLRFLANENPSVVNRSMLDLMQLLHACKIGFSSDASAAEDLGFGCVFRNQ